MTIHEIKHQAKISEADWQQLQEDVNTLRLQLTQLCENGAVLASLLNYQQRHIKALTDEITGLKAQ